MVNQTLVWVWRPSLVSMQDQHRPVKIKVVTSMRQFRSIKKSMTTHRVPQVQLVEIMRSDQRRSHSRSVNFGRTYLKREPLLSTQKKIQTKVPQKKLISHNILRFQQLPPLVLQCSSSRHQDQFKLSRCSTIEYSKSSRIGSLRSMQLWETPIWGSINRTSTKTQAGEMTELLKWISLSIHKRVVSKT